METKENMVLPNMTEEQKEAFRIFTEHFPTKGMNDFLNYYKGHFDDHASFAKFMHEKVEQSDQIPIWAYKFVAWESVWEVQLKPYYVEINGYYFDKQLYY